jgi:hypothetical protein
MVLEREWELVMVLEREWRGARDGVGAGVEGSS